MDSTSEITCSNIYKFCPSAKKGICSLISEYKGDEKMKIASRANHAGDKIISEHTLSSNEIHDCFHRLKSGLSDEFPECISGYDRWAVAFFVLLFLSVLLFMLKRWINHKRPIQKFITEGTRRLVRFVIPKKWSGLESFRRGKVRVNKKKKIRISRYNDKIKILKLEMFADVHRFEDLERLFPDFSYDALNRTYSEVQKIRKWQKAKGIKIGKSRNYVFVLPKRHGQRFSSNFEDSCPGD